MVAKYILATASLIGTLLFPNYQHGQAQDNREKNPIVANIDPVIYHMPAVTITAKQDPQQERWIRQTIGKTRGSRSCAFVARKRSNTLELYCRGKLAESFHMELGWSPLEDKLKEGDGATPEGRYSISRVRDIGQTSFYRAFLINYPTGQDRKEFRAARKAGLVDEDDSPGGLIEIHGRGGRGKNWTAGCMALTDDEMDVLFKYVNAGKIRNRTPITIVK